MVSPVVVHLVPINHSASDVINDSSVSGTTVKDALNNLTASVTSDVTGPASSTDNEIARFDGTTGKIIQGESGHVTITDAGVIVSDVATGTAPFTVASTTKITNLNADLLDGKDTGTSGNTIPLLDGTNTWSNTQTFSNIIDSALTSGRVVLVDGSSILTDDAGLTYDTVNDLLTAQTGLTISGGTLSTHGFNLTGRVTMTAITGIVSSTAGSSVTMVGGSGFTTVSGAATGGNGGGFTMTAGAAGGNTVASGGGEAGTAGNFTMTAGNAGSMTSGGITNRTGGTFTMTAGSGGTRTNSSADSGGGSFSLTAGGAGISTKNTGSGSYTGSSGGGFTASVGAGGFCTSTVGDSTGGVGGAVSFSGGVGGSGRCATGFNALGGDGTSFTFTAGSGGSGTRSSVGQTPTTSTGGSGGSLTFTAGDGGDATQGTSNTKGSGGSILFNPGATGLSGTGGSVGNVRLAIARGNIHMGIDNTSTLFGTGLDASIVFTGTELQLTSDLITATDSMLLRAGTNGLKLNIGATQQAILTSLLFSYTEAVNLAFGTTTGTKIGTATTQKIGFYNSTPIVQPTDGATLTNNVTSGGTTNQIDDWTNLTVYATDAAAIRNAIYQLSRKLKIVVDNLRSLGLES